MNEIKVAGKQKFMGLDIPVVLGGFGEGKKCISDKTIAEIHGMREPDVRRRITDNIKRFKENVDYIDFKERLCGARTLDNEGVHVTHTLEILLSLGYAKQSITQAEHIYILSERGYAKLIKIMDTDLAWNVHDKLMDEYFELREEKRNGPTVEDVEQLIFNPDFGIKLLTALKEKKAENEQLHTEVVKREARIAEMRPKEVFADAVASSHTSILIGDLAKLLKQNGINTGQKRLFARLRDEGFLIKSGSSKNIPTQKAMDMGLFEIKEGSYVDANGCNVTTKTTKVTGKGQQYFINRYLNKQYEQEMR